MTDSEMIREIHAMLKQLVTGVAPAADHELDSDYANFVVEKMPAQWKGQDFSGSRLSETSAEFCRAVASLQKWKGDKDKASGKTYVNKKNETVMSHEYEYKKAAWALGWAARLEAKPASKPADKPPVDDDSIPF